MKDLEINTNKNTYKMSEFKKYKRKQIAELRPVDLFDVEMYIRHREIRVMQNKDNVITVSISDEDLKNGSPKKGDMIARNPTNHMDQWLVAKQYFNDNFERL